MSLLSRCRVCLSVRRCVVYQCNATCRCRGAECHCRRCHCRRCVVYQCNATCRVAVSVTAVECHCRRCAVYQCNATCHCRQGVSVSTCHCRHATCHCRRVMPRAVAVPSVTAVKVRVLSRCRVSLPSRCHVTAVDVSCISVMPSRVMPRVTAVV